MSSKQEDRFDARASAMVLSLVAAAYIGLSLVAFYKQDWLPDPSDLHMFALGPPALLLWGRKLNVLFGLCTGAMVLLMITAAFRSTLRLPAALAALVIWFGAGWISVLLSV